MDRALKHADLQVIMESGKFFEGFVEAIAGAKAGDTRLVPVTFPGNHKVCERTDLHVYICARADTRHNTQRTQTHKYNCINTYTRAHKHAHTYTHA